MTLSKPLVPISNVAGELGVTVRPSTKWKTSVVTLIVCISAVAGATAALSCEDQCVKIEVQDINDQTVVFANVSNLLEATVTFDAKLTNMTSNVPLPVTAVVGPGKTPIVSLSSERVRGAKRYHYEYHWQKGMQDPVGYVKGQYVICFLPFPRGRAYCVDQGFMGAFSHYPGSQSEYAVDFGLREGDTICAALPGTVIGLRSDSNSGGTDKRFLPCANYIIIKHNDGTYGEYAHLRQGGVLVRLGQAVNAGQPIGLAGATGQASAPHLHFAVYKVKSGVEKVSFPIVFKTSAGILKPKQDEVMENN